MGEVLVSIVLERVASIIHRMEEEGIRLFWVAELQVEKLKSNFLAIQDVLADAEERQDHADVREWLYYVKRIAYHIDDALDEWNMEIQKLQIKKAEYASKPLKKVSYLVSYYLSCFRPHFLHYDIAAKIMNLQSELDDISKKKSRFNFSSVTKGKLARQTTASFIDEDEKNQIINIIGTNNMILASTWSKEECWSLFSQLAFSEKTNKNYGSLEAIGKEIVRHCMKWIEQQNVLLAIKILGSLLRLKRDIKEWEYISNNIWFQRRLFLLILLSYNDLPPPLKRCFSYCAMFPKGYEIQKDYLIKLWMARDYIRAEENKDIELIGEEYFETLVIRSFFQDFKKDEIDNSIKSFKLHDIVHEAARFLNQFEYEPLFGYYLFQLLVICRGGALFPDYIYGEIRLRCLVVKWDGIATEIDLPKLFDKLIYLRILDLSDCSLKKLPTEIKNLIHLRYLNLSANDIKELPKTLCGLYNLQTLDLTSCRSLKKLPQGIGKFVNLRHLLNSQTPLNYMPKSAERLTNLRTLSQFVVRDDGYGSKSCSLKSLENLNHLLDIGIDGLGNVKDVGEAKVAKLNKKKNLHTLCLRFNGSLNEKHEVLLEALQPPLNLMKLQIIDYDGSTLSPNWMVSLTKLRRLSLCNCVKCEHLPPFGKLSSLEILEIRDLSSVKSVGNEFLGIESDRTSSSSSSSVICFPKLKYLSFEFMREWEEWNYNITNSREEDVTIMPCLETLKISHCYKLNSLPNHLDKMKTLEKDISECPLLKRTL